MTLICGIRCPTDTRRVFGRPLSNTGWISVGELAMTPRISLVAVCCSRAFAEVLEQPGVLYRGHRLIGKSFEQILICTGREGKYLGATFAARFPI